jgi:hypothetical protein
LNVWVIDDDPKSLKPALEAIQEFKCQSGLEISVRSSTDFCWPPHFTDDRSVWLGELPDVVILDLLYGGATLAGDKFYRALRHEEAEQRKSACAFVIIWSYYLTNPDVEEFTTNAKATDDRLLSVDMKHKLELDRLLSKCVRRMDEENPMLRLSADPVHGDKKL